MVDMGMEMSAPSDIWFDSSNPPLKRLPPDPEPLAHSRTGTPRDEFQTVHDVSNVFETEQSICCKQTSAQEI